jgi:hypothetical protein
VLVGFGPLAGSSSFFSSFLLFYFSIWVSICFAELEHEIFFEINLVSNTGQYVVWRQFFGVHLHIKVPWILLGFR